MSRRPLCLLLAVLLVLPLTACGGGGGAGGMTPAVFIGPYFVNALEWSSTADSGRTTWGIWTADGMDNFTAAWSENRDGTVNAGLVNPTSSFAVAADGGLTIGFPPTPGPFYTGGITTDGDLAIFAQTRDGSAPYIGLAFRRTGIHGNLDLSGTHHYVGWLKQPPGSSNFYVFWGKVGYDGEGGLSSTETISFNRDGHVFDPVATLSGTYVVAADGTATGTTNLFDNPLQGGVYGSGDLVHMTGATDSGTLESMLTFPVGAGLDDSTLSGSYWMAGLIQEFGVPATQAVVGTAQADGAGLLALDLATNREGVIGSLPEGLGYSVASDGTITAGTVVGAVSPDGRFAFLAGPNGSGDDPLILWLVRKN